MGASASHSSSAGHTSYDEPSANLAISSLLSRLSGSQTIPFDDVFWDILVDTLEQHSSSISEADLTPLVDNAAVRFVSNFSTSHNLTLLFALLIASLRHIAAFACDLPHSLVSDEREPSRWLSVLFWLLQRITAYITVNCNVSTATQVLSLSLAGYQPTSFDTPLHASYISPEDLPPPLLSASERAVIITQSLPKLCLADARSCLTHLLAHSRTASAPHIPLTSSPSSTFTPSATSPISHSTSLWPALAAALTDALARTTLLHSSLAAVVAAAEVTSDAADATYNHARSSGAGVDGDECTCRLADACETLATAMAMVADGGLDLAPPFSTTPRLNACQTSSHTRQTCMLPSESKPHRPHFAQPTASDTAKFHQESPSELPFATAQSQLRSFQPLLTAGPPRPALLEYLISRTVTLALALASTQLYHARALTPRPGAGAVPALFEAWLGRAEAGQERRFRAEGRGANVGREGRGERRRGSASAGLGEAVEVGAEQECAGRKRGARREGRDGISAAYGMLGAASEAVLQRNDDTLAQGDSAVGHRILGGDTASHDAYNSAGAGAAIGARVDARPCGTDVACVGGACWAMAYSSPRTLLLALLAAATGEEPEDCDRRGVYHRLRARVEKEEEREREKQRKIEKARAVEGMCDHSGRGTIHSDLTLHSDTVSGGAVAGHGAESWNTGVATLGKPGAALCARHAWPQLLLAQIDTDMETAAEVESEVEVAHRGQEGGSTTEIEVGVEVDPSVGSITSTEIAPAASVSVSNAAYRIAFTASPDAPLRPSLSSLSTLFLPSAWSLLRPHPLTDAHAHPASSRLWSALGALLAPLAAPTPLRAFFPAASACARAPALATALLVLLLAQPIGQHAPPPQLPTRLPSMSSRPHVRPSSASGIPLPSSSTSSTSSTPPPRSSISSAQSSAPLVGGPLAALLHSCTPAFTAPQDVVSRMLARATAKTHIGRSCYHLDYCEGDHSTRNDAVLPAVGHTPPSFARSVPACPSTHTSSRSLSLPLHALFRHFSASLVLHGDEAATAAPSAPPLLLHCLSSPAFAAYCTTRASCPHLILALLRPLYAAAIAPAQAAPSLLYLPLLCIHTLASDPAAVYEWHCSPPPPAKWHPAPPSSSLASLALRILLALLVANAAHLRDPSLHARVLALMHAVMLNAVDLDDHLCNALVSLTARLARQCATALDKETRLASATVSTLQRLTASRQLPHMLDAVVNAAVDEGAHEHSVASPAPSSTVLANATARPHNVSASLSPPASSTTPIPVSALSAVSSSSRPLPYSLTPSAEASATPSGSTTDPLFQAPALLHSLLSLLALPLHPRLLPENPRLAFWLLQQAHEWVSLTTALGVWLRAQRAREQAAEVYVSMVMRAIERGAADATRVSASGGIPARAYLSVCVRVDGVDEAVAEWTSPTFTPHTPNTLLPTPPVSRTTHILEGAAAALAASAGTGGDWVALPIRPARLPGYALGLRQCVLLTQHLHNELAAGARNAGDAGSRSARSRSVSSVGGHVPATGLSGVNTSTVQGAHVAGVVIGQASADAAADGDDADADDSGVEVSEAEALSLLARAARTLQAQAAERGVSAVGQPYADLLSPTVGGTLPVLTPSPSPVPAPSPAAAATASASSHAPPTAFPPSSRSTSSATTAAVAGTGLVSSPPHTPPPHASILPPTGSSLRIALAPSPRAPSPQSLHAFLLPYAWRVCVELRAVVHNRDTVALWEQDAEEEESVSSYHELMRGA